MVAAEIYYIRKARKLQAVVRRFNGPKMSVDDIIKWIKSTPTCTYCNEPIKLKDYSVDHIQPRALGGTNGMSNLHLVDKGCNKMKGDFTDKQFRSLVAYAKKTGIYLELRKRLRASGFMYKRG